MVRDVSILMLKPAVSLRTNYMPTYPASISCL